MKSRSPKLSYIKFYRNAGGVGLRVDINSYLKSDEGKKSLEDVKLLTNKLIKSRFIIDKT